MFVRQPKMRRHLAFEPAIMSDEKPINYPDEPQSDKVKELSERIIASKLPVDRKAELVRRIGQTEVIPEAVMTRIETPEETPVIQLVTQQPGLQKKEKKEMSETNKIIVTVVIGVITAVIAGILLKKLGSS